jgi:hypothetical protein
VGCSVAAAEKRLARAHKRLARTFAARTRGGVGSPVFQEEGR